MMCVYFCFGIKDPLLINIIDAYPSTRMNNSVVLQENSGMKRFAVLIREENQVAGPGLREGFHFFAMRSLLPHPARKRIAGNLENHLHQPTRIDSKRAFTTPLIRSINEFQSDGFQEFVVPPLAQAFRYAIKGELFLHFEKFGC